MLTNILIGLLCYSLVLVFLLVGWHRVQVRLWNQDKALAASLAAMQNATPRELIPGPYVRPYAE